MPGSDLRTALHWTTSTPGVLPLHTLAMHMPTLWQAALADHTLLAAGLTSVSGGHRGDVPIVHTTFEAFSLP